MHISRTWWWALAVLPAAAFTFQSATTLSLSRQGLLSTSVDVADFNRDGVGDVVSANASRVGTGGTNSIGVLLGVRGTLSGGTLLELPVNGTPMQVLAADFNRDGNVDIAALVISDSSITDRARLCIYPGNGFGTFESPLCSTLPGTPSRMAAADFNRDGALDVMMLRANEATVFTMLNAGNGMFSAGPSASVQQPAAFAVADFNGDAMPDAAVVSQSGLLTLLLSSGATPFQTQQSWSIAAGATDIVAADLNRDGRADVVIANPGSNTLTAGFGLAGGTSALGSLTTYQMPVAAYSLRAADLNGDQAPEIVAASSAGIVVYPIQADGMPTAPSLPGMIPFSQKPLAVGDLNGDGRLDILAVPLDINAAGPVALLGTATATVTRLEVSPGMVGYGSPITLTIRVQLAQNSPVTLPLVGASVQLLDGTRELQRVPLSAPASGSTGDLASARVDVVLPAGSLDLSVRFLGTPTYLGSSSPTVRVTVQPSATQVHFQALPSDVSYTQGLRLNATVRWALGTVSEGIVKLAVNGSVIAQSFATGGLSQLFIPPGMPLGKIKVQLLYEGTNYMPSSSEVVEYPVKGGTLTAVSAASYGPAVAPDSLAVLGVAGLVRPAGISAAEVPWPKSLAEVEAQLIDASGTRLQAGLTYAGSRQVNIHLPAETPLGLQKVVLLVDGVEAATGEVRVAAVAPGLFSADGSGRGAPAAFAAIYDGETWLRDLAVFQCGGGRCLPGPLSVGAPGESLILTLFGTGWRGARTVTATIAGRTVEVLYSGPQPSAPGLDQLNVRVPRELSGVGEVDLLVIADGVATNAGRLLLR